MSVIVFENARIITSPDADPLENGYLVVEDNLIRELGPGEASLSIDGQKTINCGGHTLLPGLIDCHVHLGAFDPNLVEIGRRYHTSYRIIRTLEMMRLALDQGFTTVRDCGGADPGLRQAVSEGRVPGPRLSVCGPVISQTGGHADLRLATENYPPQRLEGGLTSIVVDGKDACRQVCRDLLRQGVDFLKIMGSGGAASPSDEVDSVQYSGEEIRVMCDEATNAGTYVSSHCYADRAIIQSVENGVRTVEHGNLMSREGALAIKAHDAYLVPTLATYHEYSKRGRSLGLPEANIAKINTVKEKGLESLALALEAGVRIGLGSDLLGPMQDSMARSLTLQAEVMGATGALTAATMTNAEIIGMEDQLGTLAPGKLADIIAVKENPMERISVFEDFAENISLIVQDGRVYKNTM
jgi:imidazolonepropionase-like amidohydrolase